MEEEEANASISGEAGRGKICHLYAGRGGEGAEGAAGQSDMTGWVRGERRGGDGAKGVSNA